MELDDMRETMLQKYAPTARPFERETYFEEFLHKEFERGDVAELFHENSKLTEVGRAKLNRSSAEFTSAPFDEALANVSPDYSECESVSLPDVTLESGRSFEDVLANRRSERSFSGDGISLETLSQVLRCGCGATRVVQATGKKLRSYPSAGGLYPVEMYVGILRSDDLEPGLYYYNADDHDLKVLRRGESVADELRDAFAGEAVNVENAALTIALTGAFWRSKAKYGPRGHRYALQEAGHVAQNVYLASEAYGLGCVAVGGFYDDAMNDALELDGVNEAVVYPLVLGDVASAAARE